jgi:Skp family chaperone for outer membrane proteins
MSLKSLSFLTAILILVAAAASAAHAAAAGAAPGAGVPAAPPPTKLAVLNVVDLFSDLLERRDNETSLDNLKRDLEEQNRKLQNTVKDMEDGLKNFAAGTPEYRKAQEDYLKKAMELQSFGSFAQQKLLIEQRLYTVSLYRKINDAVARYSASSGIAIVFVAESATIERAPTQEGLQTLINSRKILYAHPSFDITNKVREMMNSEYSGGRPAATRP